MICGIWDLQQSAIWIYFANNKTPGQPNKSNGRNVCPQVFFIVCNPALFLQRHTLYSSSPEIIARNMSGINPNKMVVAEMQKNTAKD